MRGRNTIGTRRYGTVLNRSAKALNRSVEALNRCACNMNQECCSIMQEFRSSIQTFLSHETKVSSSRQKRRSTKQKCLFIHYPVLSMPTIICFLELFYTSIYNIRLGFINIESKIGRALARTKSAKKTVSLRRSIPSPRRRKSGP